MAKVTGRLCDRISLETRSPEFQNTKSILEKVHLEVGFDVGEKGGIVYMSGKVAKERWRILLRQLWTLEGGGGGGGGGLKVGHDGK